MFAEQLDVFSRVMMLNDLYAFRRNNPNTDLPFGYSTEELNAERIRFVGLAKADKKQ